MRCPPMASVASTTPSPGTRTSARSLNATASSPSAPNHSPLCCSTVKSSRSSRSSASGSSSGWISTRNPRLPRLTPSTGTGRRATSRNAPSIVPSPPRLTTASARLASSASDTTVTSPSQRVASSARISSGLPCTSPTPRSRRAPGLGPAAGARRARSRIRRPPPAGYRPVRDARARHADCRSAGGIAARPLISGQPNRPATGQGDLRVSRLEAVLERGAERPPPRCEGRLRPPGRRHRRCHNVDPCRQLGALECR